MKIPRVRFLNTAYHMVLASPVAWIRNQGAGGSPDSGAMPASMSWCCVAT